MNTKTLLIHNPSCSKSRGAKEILEEKNIQFETLEYLKGGLPDDILQELPKILNVDYPAMIRTGESIYRELQLGQKNISSNEWMEILRKHPVLLERPIFIHQGKGVIARPPEKVLEIL